MLSTPRRITFYWLLLLLPTLAVGVGSLVLLHREQLRLTERAAAADAARRSAVEARAQIVAENAALLVGEVQAGLLEALRELPAAGLDGALDLMERNNPFVHSTFLCRPDGTLLRPREEEYQRRFYRLLTAQPPWSVVTDLLKDESTPKAEVPSEVQKRAYSNISQRQLAMDEVRKVAQINRPPAGGSTEYDTFTNAPTPGRSEAERVTPSPDRSGWVPWFADNQLYLLGWMQPGGSGEVRGVELDLTALVSRLAPALPGEPGPGERYVLRDDRGRVLHQAGEVNVAADMMPAVRLEISAALPHWEIAGWSVPTFAGSAGPGGWFIMAALLVGIFVLAILTGGLLLLVQARRSEAEAAQKTSFVANVSHEFKTPLTTIRLYAELLAAGRVREQGRQEEYLQTIGRETQRLSRLVGNVLDFSRLEQGRKKYQREPLELSQTLDGLLTAHEPRIVEAGLQLVRVLPTESVEVTTDRDALEQIVLNLLDNACKYAAAGAEVTVEVARRAEGGTEVRVLDRGPGVPAAHRDQIFEKFHRVDDALTAEQTGAGLGLGIARQLARGLGGDLRHAPRDGGGAIFILTLP